MKFIYKPSYLLQDDRFEEGKGVLVQDGRIEEVDQVELLLAKYPDAEHVDWTNLVLVPGTVNAHNHSFQSLLRGLVTDRPFLEWRDKALYHYSPHLNTADLYTGALFAFGEMLRYGVTTVCDFFYLHNDGLESDEAIIQAAKLGVQIEGATLYCTHQPCSVCAKMIVNAGIRRVVYEQGYPDNFSLEIFNETGVTLEKMEPLELTEGEK